MLLRAVEIGGEPMSGCWPLQVASKVRWDLLRMLQIHPCLSRDLSLERRL